VYVCVYIYVCVCVCVELCRCGFVCANSNVLFLEGITLDIRRKKKCVTLRERRKMLFFLLLCWFLLQKRSPKRLPLGNEVGAGRLIEEIHPEADVVPHEIH
jgi:hypothetical protein